MLRTTASYHLWLTIGPAEAMYTQAEVKAKHPASGEVMVGASTSVGSMSMGGANRHLEIKITTRAGDRVVTGVTPSIALTDTTGMAMAEKVNAMAMEGIGRGVADLHYGDNVKLAAGHVYKVVVSVKGERATFTFKA